MPWALSARRLTRTIPSAEEEDPVITAERRLGIYAENGAEIDPLYR